VVVGTGKGIDDGLKDTFWVNVYVCYLDGSDELIDVY